ncbi:metal-dependent hydrolase [Effusibacillus dendaii]|uniref:Metal-dependent hydrolase n=1 Tax=Effusibacillus dendaii TaxID=2743772 RepID=A0A7I8DD74_9BACL|nr:metal-dependent hydrolase [Effusibacillus dendaii]BCJ87232.1 hypothetical protein skT53_22170 [Effusibacillus dendaii]
MDTASHFLIGVGLGGLAHLSPLVATNPVLGTAITIGTVIASEAPDFDYVYKWKGQAAYLKNHRGITHSIPALLIWPTVITFCMLPFFTGIDGWLLWLWCLIAVCIHVGLDVLNTYGTQALRPFSEKWLSKDILMILDPFIFITQLAGILLWAFGIFSPGPMFGWIDGVTLVYILIRAVYHRRLVRMVANQMAPGGTPFVRVIPTFRFWGWQVIVETEEQFLLGKIQNGSFVKEMTLQKLVDGLDYPLNMKSEVADAFLYFAQSVYRQVEETDGKIRLKLTDLRFRFGDSFPFSAIVEMTPDGHVENQYLGWSRRNEQGEKIRLKEFLKK